MEGIDDATSLFGNLLARLVEHSRHVEGGLRAQDSWGLFDEFVSSDDFFDRIFSSFAIHTYRH
jgi:hypothetical protein